MTGGRSDGIVRRRGAVIGTLSAAQRDWHALRTGSCKATSLPLPVFVVLEACVRGDATLTRFDAAGDFCGNTWHASERVAESQAVVEFGDALGPWIMIPTGVEPVDFLLSGATS